MKICFLALPACALVQNLQASEFQRNKWLPKLDETFINFLWIAESKFANATAGSNLWKLAKSIARITCWKINVFFSHLRIAQQWTREQASICVVVFWRKCRCLLCGTIKAKTHWFYGSFQLAVTRAGLKLDRICAFAFCKQKEPPKTADFNAKQLFQGGDVTRLFWILHSPLD